MLISLLKKPFAVSLSGNPMPFSFVITPYGVGAAKKNYTVLVRILVEDQSGSGSFTEAHQQPFFPNAVGQVNVDIQTQIDPYLDYYLPRLSLAKMVMATGQFKQYQVGYTLLLDGVSIAAESFSPVLSVIKGGMAKEEWHPSEWATDYLFAQQNFLCFNTLREKSLPEAQSFLFFMAPVNDVFTCTVTLVDDAGQPHLLTLPTAISMPGYALGCLPSGYEQLGLHSLLAAGSFGLKYTVTITGSISGVVAQRTFRLDFRNFYNPAIICYRNSLGGLETAVLRGQVDFEADYAFQQANHISAPTYFKDSILVAEQEQLTEETFKTSGDTGFNDRETTNKFRDFFNSKQRLEIKNGKFLPIILLNKNVKFFSNNDHLISIQLQWQSTFTNEYFTPAGLMPVGRTCPGVESLQVKQVNKSTLQISWSLPFPYDIIEVQLVTGVITPYSFVYKGNVGTVMQPFINPSSNGVPASITVNGRVVCDENIPDYGAFTTINLPVVGNSLPILVNDTFIVNAGLTTAAVMSGSVLANDYDPDGDTLVVVAASGTTNDGGIYTIDGAGNVTYKPPTASYNGLDYVDYQANDGTGTNVTARMYFKVGGSVSGAIFMKAFTKNVATTVNGYGNGIKTTIGEFWIGAFSDPAAQNPLDVTGMGLVVNYLHNDDYVYAQNPNTSVPGTVAMTGTAVQVYQGEIYLELTISATLKTTHTVTFPVQAGNGYTAL